MLEEDLSEFLFDPVLRGRRHRVRLAVLVEDDDAWGDVLGIDCASNEGFAGPVSLITAETT